MGPIPPLPPPGGCGRGSNGAGGLVSPCATPQRPAPHLFPYRRVECCPGDAGRTWLSGGKRTAAWSPQPSFFTYGTGMTQDCEGLAMNWRETFGALRILYAQFAESRRAGVIVRILRIGMQKRKTPICWRPWPTSAGDSISRSLKPRKHWRQRTSTTGARARSAAIPWPHSPAHWCSGGKGIKASALPTTPSRPPASTAARSGCGSTARFHASPGAGTEHPTNRKPLPDCGTRTGAIMNAFYQGYGKPTTTNQSPQGLKHQGEFSK